jgi:hypothetical protein
MATPDEITQKLRQLAEISHDVYEYLKPEWMTVRSITDDTNRLLKMKIDLVAELEMIKQSNDRVRVNKEQILAEARAEGEEIKRKAQEYFVKAVRENEAAAKEHEEAKRLKIEAQKELTRVKKVAA